MRGLRPERRLEAIVARELKPVAGETILAAISGGPDSVALAALLRTVCAREGARLVLGHVNHAVRPGAWQDEAVVLALGAALGVPVRCASLEPAPDSGEAALREGRYRTLERLAAEAGAHRVATAHHAQDQTETVLLALFRGTGPAGLAGMRPARPLGKRSILVRPLLEVDRGSLRALCEAEHLPYAIDPTNADPRYARNAVRAALADLRPNFPRLDEAVARCARIVRDELDGSGRAILRARLREELAAGPGLRDVPFERLEAAARALEAGRPGRHHIKRGVAIDVPAARSENPQG
jgi:tRNA(Ile)-lysidine synthase